MSTNKPLIAQMPVEETINVADNIVNSRDQAVTVLIGVIALLLVGLAVMWRKNEKNSERMQELLISQIETNAKSISTIEKMADQHQELTDEFRTLKTQLEINGARIQSTLDHIQRNRES